MNIDFSLPGLHCVCYYFTPHAETSGQVDREAAGVMLHSSRSASPPAAMAQFTLLPWSSAQHRPQDQSSTDVDLLDLDLGSATRTLDFNHLDHWTADGDGDNDEDISVFLS